MSALKREHSKSKAGKAFTRQFGDTTASAADSGPRAALYKGEMGRSHKRATNMQNTGSQKKINGRAVFSLTAFDWKGSPRKSAGIMVAACLVLSCLFLYSPAQQYYSAVRQNQQAQAEYAALVERNENIQSSVETLTSSEGIEDRARKELGWVKEGENAVTVYGVASENNPSSYVKSIPAGSVEAPNSWYTPVLDFLFGVQ